MILAAAFRDEVAHVLDDFRKAVRSDMRTGVYKDLGVGSEMDELVQDFPDIPSLRGTGVEFTVRKGSGATFSETIIGFRIDNPFAGDDSHVCLPPVYIFPPLEDNGPEAEGDQLE